MSAVRQIDEFSARARAAVTRFHSRHTGSASDESTMAWSAAPSLLDTARSLQVHGKGGQLSRTARYEHHAEGGTSWRASSSLTKFKVPAREQQEAARRKDEADDRPASPPSDGHQAVTTSAIPLRQRRSPGCSSMMRPLRGPLCARATRAKGSLDVPEEDVSAMPDLAHSKGIRSRTSSTRTCTRIIARAAAPWRSSRAPATASTSADVAFPFEPLDDGQEIELGNTRVRVLHTPGITESLCLVVTDSVAWRGPLVRPHGGHALRGRGRAPRPARARPRRAPELHRSLHERLLACPTPRDLPGHFAGSACGAGMSGKPSRTLAFEKRWNPVLTARGRSSSGPSTRRSAKPADMEATLRFNQGGDGGESTERTCRGGGPPRPGGEPGAVLAARARQRLRGRDGRPGALHPARPSRSRSSTSPPEPPSCRSSSSSA